MLSKMFEISIIVFMIIGYPALIVHWKKYPFPPDYQRKG